MRLNSHCETVGFLLMRRSGGSTWFLSRCGHKIWGMANGKSGNNVSLKSAYWLSQTQLIIRPHEVWPIPRVWRSYCPGHARMGTSMALMWPFLYSLARDRALWKALFGSVPYFETVQPQSSNFTNSFTHAHAMRQPWKRGQSWKRIRSVFYEKELTYYCPLPDKNHVVECLVKSV